MLTSSIGSKIFTPSAPKTKLKSTYFNALVWSPKQMTGLLSLNTKLGLLLYPAMKFSDWIFRGRSLNFLPADSLQLLILMYGFIAVISFIGAVNIINTITTNLVLRRKEIASLNAIGMTYKNIRSMILTEGVLYGLYGAFYGGVVGSLLSYGLSYFMKEIMNFKWSIPWNMIFISGAAAVFIGLISVIKPLSRIKKENVIDVIREEN